MKAKVWLGRVLLGFVLVTIGFALGRQTAPPAPSTTGTSIPATPGTTGADKVIVYSVHMTFRCWECNQIEWLTKELLEREFARELASGRIEYRSVDYMKDTDFARRYDIAASTVVVVRIESGREVAYDRLDAVWTKARKRDEFMAYVREAIRIQLERLPREKV